MIVSIGIDLIEVARVGKVLTRTPRFAERVFTVAERRYCESRGAVAAQSYAARFAAKEATFKALGTGWSGKLAWHDVEVATTNRGAPILVLHNHARELFRELGATDAHLSISHTIDHAIAQVILERRTR